jgi:hypothetical protein
MHDSDVMHLGRQEGDVGCTRNMAARTPDHHHRRDILRVVIGEIRVPARFLVSSFQSDRRNWMFLSFR